VGPTGGQYGANRVDTSFGFKDIYDKANGNATFYRQYIEAGYSAPGLTTPTNIEQYGGSARTSVTDNIDVRVKADKKSQDFALETSAIEANIDYKLDGNWTLSSGVRNDVRTDHSRGPGITHRVNGVPMVMFRTRSKIPAIVKPTAG
jgi:hypothetical protein